MECGTYYAKDQKMIVLQKESGWKKEIKYIIKSYSSMMLSFVLLCYLDADTEEAGTICFSAVLAMLPLRAQS